jgi:hypothetical protein
MYGFSYLYDRTAAIGLFDGKPVLSGSQRTSRTQIERGGASLCIMEAQAIKARYRAHPDARQADQFCGDVAYIVALLEALRIAPDAELVVAKEIKGVELVWTLGAMIANAAQLPIDGDWTTMVAPLATGLLAGLLLLWLCTRRAVGCGYRRVQQADDEQEDAKHVPTAAF